MPALPEGESTILIHPATGQTRPESHLCHNPPTCTSKLKTSNLVSRKTIHLGNLRDNQKRRISAQNPSYRLQLVSKLSTPRPFELEPARMPLMEKEGEDGEGLDLDMKEKSMLRAR